MKKLASILIVLCAALGIQAANVAVTTDSSGVLKSATNIFNANSTVLSSVIGVQLGSSNVVTVSPTGNNSTAAIGNAARPYATIGAAAAAIPNNSILNILPGTYAQTPAYPAISGVSGLNALPVLFQNKTNITISAVGASITGSGDACHIGFVNCSNIRVVGLDLNLTHGNGSAITNSYIGAISLFGTNQNITFSRCSVRGATDQGITTSRLGSGLVVEDCYFYHNGTTNAAYVSGFNPVIVPYPWVDGTAVSGLISDSRVSRNKFEFCYRAIELDDATGSTAKIGDILIDDNKITNCLHVGIFTYSGNSPANFSKLKIINNNVHFYTNSPGLGSAFSSIDSRIPLATNQFQIGIDIGGGENIEVRGNNVDNSWDYGIRSLDSAPIKNLSILNNTVIGNTVSQTNGLIRIQCTTALKTDGVKVSGNTLANAGGNGVYITGHNVLVSDNLVKDVAMAVPSPGYTFLVAGNSSTSSSNVVFRGNLCYNSRASTQPYGVGVGANTADSIWIGRDNYFFGVQSGTHQVNSGNYSKVEWDGQTGTGTLSGGAATITANLVKAGSMIILSPTSFNGTPGNLRVSAITANTSFGVTSSSGTDANTFRWEIRDSRQ